jgi:DNA topoisomerase-1
MPAPRPPRSSIPPTGEATPQPLTYADDRTPGISRVRRGKGFSWHLPCGQRICDPLEIRRLAAIGMPPAYQHCWFSPDPSGHILATGYDARGRKQYRYHPTFRSGQDATKFALCAAFGEALPAMRAQIDASLKARSVTRERCLAAVVRVLDVAHLRIGNRQYARANQSFGVSTLRKRHVTVRGNAVELKFRGKSGKMQQRTVRDRSLLRVVRDLQDLSGQHLFQYRDAAGQPHEISSGDVNRYIGACMGDSFSAKHFRTWGGTLVAFEAWVAARGAITLDAVLRKVADELGNTPTVSRKSYVHPAVIAAIKTRAVNRLPTRMPRPTRWLQPVERALIAFLRAAGSQ